ncbi:hypothetical protein [Enterococcus sp. AZ103]|uniref:hypothetical protein n=1 Tax=Enterococcus sp. AZ103 TaxID=2774628 RepID=UPI003F1F3E50
MTIYCSKSHHNTFPHSFAYWHSGAAGKAHYDMSTFTNEIGGKDLNIYIYNDINETDRELASRIDGILSGIKQSDILILQHPLPTSERFIKMLTEHAHFMGAMIVVYIDDISEWREISINHSINYVLFEEADGFIFHSKNMAKTFYEQIEKHDIKIKEDTKTVIRGLSGYKTAYLSGEIRTLAKKVDYAGSISKSKFLTELPPSIELTIFSNQMDVDWTLPENITLGGSFDPEAIPFQLKGSFGLVWTSDSYPEVTGSFGIYEKYNISNKLSLYLAVNLPVIVWNQSAEAEFVRRNNIGRAISDLSELPALLDSFTEEEYNEMFENIVKISPLVREGFWIKKALFEMQDKLLVK